MEIGEKIRFLADYPELPDSGYLRSLLDSVGELLDSEPCSIRPHDAHGLPGGLVRTTTPIVAIVPDLHARVTLFANLMKSTFPYETGNTIASLIADGRMTLICLGDIIHSEGRRAADRWTGAARAALRSGLPEGILSPEMDEEMGLSLRTLCAAIELKLAFPLFFHCLKGNHDNMSNAASDGDLAFFKYAAEGSMGASWFLQRYGADLLDRMRRYERSLPLVVAGKRYCASHAEPAFPMTTTRIVASRSDPEVVRGLIWTGNDEAIPGSVEMTMLSLLGGSQADRNWIWITGHRSVAGTHSLRAGKLLAQIHNPARHQVAVLDDQIDDTVPRATLYSIQVRECLPSMPLIESEVIDSLQA